MGMSRRQLCFAISSLAAASFPQNLLAHFGSSDLDKHPSKARGRFPSRSIKRKVQDANLEVIFAAISRDRLATSVAALCGLKTRWSLSPEIDDAVTLLRTEFDAAGYRGSQVTVQPFRMPSGAHSQNVLCSLGDVTSKFILIGAHFDSVSERPSSLAPGADDNASGVAVMLEIARLFRQRGLRTGLMFAAFCGEEQGLLGSTACAEIAARDRWPIELMINLDMVGYTFPGKPSKIVVEFDQGNKVTANDGASKALAMQIAQAAADHTDLQVEHTDIWNSDYMPFEDKGFACTGLYDEAAAAPFYHKSTDVIGNIDVDKLVQVTRLLAAALVSIAGLA